MHQAESFSKSSGQYIESFHLTGTRSGTRIQVAYPVRTEDRVINVICGPNNSGKTSLLNILGGSLRRLHNNRNTWNSQNEPITLTEGSGIPPSSVLVGKAWKYKDHVGSIALVKTSQLPKDRAPDRESSLRFLLRQLALHVPSARDIDVQEWITSADSRVSLVKTLEVESKLYICDQSDPFVQQLQKYLEATLYFQLVPPNVIRFALLNNSRVYAPFDKWSDGQRTLFYLALTIEYQAPNIILIDELENHLHPLFMTKALQLLKQRVPQSIVATHHPHLIFSELVDRVLFMEVTEPGQLDDPPAVLPYFKPQFQSSLRRTISLLDDDFMKIAAAYSLFDQQDHQLMRQAASIQHAFELKFFGELSVAFESEERETTGRPIPDRQTLQVVDLIRSANTHADGQTAIRILDLGAGLGRLELEASKLTEWRTGKRLEWITWAHTETGRRTLKDRLKSLPDCVRIPNSLSEVPDGSCHITVLANVLHEVNLKSVAELLATAARKAQREDGVIVVLELYPLLKAEKYAVAYPPSSMISILNNSGFTATCNSFPIQDATGYCIAARARGIGTVTEESIVTATEAAWRQLELDIASSYATRRSVHNSTDYRSVLNDLMSLASMQAWRLGLW